MDLIEFLGASKGMKKGGKGNWDLILASSFYHFGHKRFAY